MSDIEQTARHLKQSTQTAFVPRHEYRKVEARLFGHLDLGFYDEARDYLVAQGGIWFGDFENLTVKASAIDLRTFIRILTAEDQTICICLYHPKPKLWTRLLLWIARFKLGRTVDCETEFPDGRYLITNNAQEASRLTLPPGFDEQYLPADTSYEVVFQTHQQRLKDFLAANPGVPPTMMRTAEEVMEMQHRMQAIKAAYRKEVGGVTKDELENFGVDSATAAKIKQEMDHQDR